MRKREHSLSERGEAMTATFQKLPKQRQDEILAATAAVFAEKGYHQAGIVEICHAAGISNGAMYKYFRNKKGLFLAVARRAGEIFMQSAVKTALGKMSFWERVMSILDQVPVFTSEHRDYVLVYMDIGTPSMSEFATELSDDLERMSVQFWRHLIDEAREAGEIRQGISTTTAAYVLDNYLMLFAFSCVSEHYQRRFQQFYGKPGQPVKAGRKVDLIIKSLSELLG